MGKVCFWGQSFDIQQSSTIRHRYKYVKHHIGPNRREVRVKIPNVECMKRTIIARKLLHMNFVFGRARKYGKYGKPLDAAWLERVQQIKNGTISAKYVKSRTSLLKTKIPIEPWLDRTTESEKPTPSDCGHLSSERLNQGGSVGQVEADEEWIPTLSLVHHQNSSQHPAGCEDENRGTRRTLSARSTPDSNESDNPCVKDHASCLKAASRDDARKSLMETLDLESTDDHCALRNSRFESEEWQRRHYPIQMRRDLGSSEVREVLASAWTYAGGSHSVYNTFMECIREATYSHDWTLASKCAEALAVELTKREKFWIMWNCGFLALANILKDDVSKIVEFGNLTRRVMQAYPLRVTIEVGTWLVQKGYFANAAFMMQEDLDEVPRLHNWKMVHFHNPKREAVDFIAHLYNTVHQYSCYKRDLQLVGNYTEEGEREAMDGTGKFVLSLFESLLARCDSIENDTTIFIEPYIEMLLRFSTKWEAKEVFHKICRNNFRNGILDELYLKFLEQQFPNLKDEIESQRNKLRRFDFTVPMAKKHIHAQQHQRYLQRKLSKGKGTQLKQIPKPSFSW